MKKINIVTLGCSKNTVDSEILAGQLAPAGWKVFFDSHEKTDMVIVNTCGFINDAKEESIEMILNFAKARQTGELKHLTVMGCLSQRYMDELKNEIPEVDRWYGVEDIESIVTDFEIQWRRDLLLHRKLSTPSHYAYVKVAEGCDRKCSFCAIPLIRGKHVSKHMDDIAEECKNLVKKGVKELLLISQDLTYYGRDLYGKNMLAELVDRLAKENPQTWIRLHYTFPLGFTDKLIEVFNSNDNVVDYIDIPLQHISSRILNSMKRGIDKKGTVELVRKFRNNMPEAAVRTAFIVGYPGETKEDFNELKEFVEELKFERMGVFTYSHEENTSAAELEDDVPQEVKDSRRDILMDIQQKISLKHNKSLLGRVMTVIIDRLEGEYWIGRTKYDSPEVDNEVLIKKTNSDTLIGAFINARITGADDYDLYAEHVK